MILEGEEESRSWTESISDGKNASESGNEVKFPQIMNHLFKNIQSRSLNSEKRRYVDLPESIS